jgi:hypothetical protein
MTYPAASSIMDWIDADDNVERDGAENEYYLSLPEPYYCKNANFETVEELLMVREVYRDMLYGDGTAPPLGQHTSSRDTSGGSLFNDPQLARGIYDLLTIYTKENNTTDDGQPRINVARLTGNQGARNPPDARHAHGLARPVAKPGRSRSSPPSATRRRRTSSTSTSRGSSRPTSWT